MPIKLMVTNIFTSY